MPSPSASFEAAPDWGRNSHSVRSRGEDGVTASERGGVDTRRAYPAARGPERETRCKLGPVLRPLLLCLPAVAAGIVAWAALGGRSEPVRYVQVLGGPTRGEHLGVLLRALRLEDGRPRPVSGLALRVTARAAGELASASGDTDSTGHLE